MLIDIEKYVRQLLPPNRREPVHVALATLLFRPIEGVIRAFNDYAYDSQFDTGTPGQVGVLQTILQIYVDANAKVIDGDGVQFDFLVLVAQPSLHKKARQLVERYKMTGKRYDVTTAVSWGDSSISFSFQPGFPRVDGSGTQGQWTVSVAVNEPGLHPTIITNTTTGKTWVNQPLQFGSGSLNFNVDQAGQYRIQVRGVVGFATAVAGGLVCDLVWLDQNPDNTGAQSLATRWQDGVRQLYIYLHSGRGGIAPFTTRIYNSSSAEVHSFVWNNPQGQWFSLPGTLGNGAYTVEVADKDGCVTGKRAITFVADVVPTLVLNSVAVSVVGGIYRLVIDFAGGTGPWSLEGRKADNGQMFSGSSGAAGPFTINLPSNTPAQTISVKVLDSASQVAEQTGVVLPAQTVSCDTVWADVHTVGAPSLATRWQGGVRQLYISLYSGRAEIAPFVTKIYQGATVVHTFNWNNPQGQWHSLPGNLGDGAYQVEVTDKDGCLTGKRSITFEAEPVSGGGGGGGSGGGTNSGSYAGMFIIERAGRRYTYADTPDLTLDVANDGKVKLLVGPTTKTSDNGQKTCDPYLLVNERVPRQAFRDALLGSAGAVFPAGKSYAIAITWMPNDTFSSYADLSNQQKMEASSLRDSDKYLNTAGQDYIYLTVENL